MATKAWWRSRTVWANLLIGVLLLAETNLHLLQPLLPLNVYQLTAFVLPILNLFLRAITRTGIGRRDEESWP